MEDRVVITGLGVISSIGIGKDIFWNNLINGVSGISPVSSFDTSNHFTHNGGEVNHFNPDKFMPEINKKHLNRSAQMGLSAAKLAVENSELTTDELSNARVGVSCGTTLGDAQTIEAINSSLINGIAPSKELFNQLPTHSTPSAISEEFNLTGPNFMFSTACAAGNYAIAYGYDLIKLSRAEIAIAGASDPMSRIEYTGFNQFSAVAPEKCRPFDKNRKGMMLAEGAGVLILEKLDHALSRGANIYAEIIGYGLSCDATHMTNPSIEGVSRCMINALSEAGIQPHDVDYISAHGTGTKANDRTECAAIKEVFGSYYKKIPISSIKSMIGHTMGAASAIEALTCAMVINDDMVPPTINYETPDPECDIDCVPNTARKHTVNIALNNSYAFGGNNASLVLAKFTN
jgi:3-oxoacyl-[acyl-carrier-protein] synthase II